MTTEPRNRKVGTLLIVLAGLAVAASGYFLVAAIAAAVLLLGFALVDARRGRSMKDR
jgi:hypothetical protein